MRQGVRIFCVGCDCFHFEGWRNFDRHHPTTDPKMWAVSFRRWSPPTPLTRAVLSGACIGMLSGRFVPGIARRRWCRCQKGSLGRSVQLHAQLQEVDDSPSQCLPSGKLPYRIGLITSRSHQGSYRTLEVGIGGGLLGSHHVEADFGRFCSKLDSPKN